MRFVFKITKDLWQDAYSALLTVDGKENAGVFLCGVADLNSEYHFLAKEFISVPNALYTDRNHYHLEIKPSFYNSMIDLCLTNTSTLVIVHSHPRAKGAWYSASDDFGESKLLPVLESLLPERRIASLLVSTESCSGRLREKNKFIPIESIRIVGNQFVIVDSKSEQSKPRPASIFERQVRAFGENGQRTIQNLRVGIIGVGGTGSAVAEQLGRLGMSDITLVDDDRIEETNLNRMYGSSLSDIGRPKADVIGQHLARLGVKHVHALTDNAMRHDVLLQLRDRDVIVSCVDNDRTRAILNRFSHQYLIPIVDIGVRLDARSGAMQAAAGRITVVGPQRTCLRCSHHLNSERIRAESLPPSERDQLTKEGYIIGIDDPEPAVISLNTTVAGLAVTALINLFVGITGADQPSNQLYDAKTGTMFTSWPVHEANCDVCGVDGVTAKGDLEIISAYN